MLHASAVAIEGRAVVFIAPKYGGKTTMAAALVRAGARLLSDDAVRIRVREHAECAAGVPSLRLRRESARHFHHVGGDESPGWRYLDRPDPEQVDSGWFPLEALYVLQPGPTESPESTRRERLDATTSALTIFRSVKLGNLLARSLASDCLGRVGDIVVRTLVYTLEFERGLDRLSRAVESLMGLHANHRLA